MVDLVFLCLPMGLCESMDAFSVKTDYVIADDILGQGKNPQEIYQQCSIVLTRIIKHNFKVSKKKCQVGSRLEFGGYVIQAQKVENLTEGEGEKKFSTNVTIQPIP